MGSEDMQPSDDEWPDVLELGVDNHSCLADFCEMEHEVYLPDRQIQAIETTLPIYDQVAFIFLAYQDPQEALRQIKNVTQIHAAEGAWQNCMIGPWIRAQGPASRATVIEILHILQHFKLLQTFGPETIDKIIHVDKFRYALFKVIDKLDYTKIKILTQKMDGHASFVEYMEIKVLTWICEGKISLTNCQGFTRALREIGLRTEAENLEETVRIQNKSNISVQYDSNAERPSNTLNAPLSSTTETCEISSYRFEPQTAGLCVIINQQNFDNSEKYPYRHGTDRDCLALNLTFKMFGFKTDVRQNLSLSELENVVESIAKRDFTSSDVLIVCLLSHGVKGAIITTDGKQVNINDLKALVTTNVTLAGKPKLFFVQACQGVEGQRSVRHTMLGITTDGRTVSSPELSDFYEAWATVPGFACYRSRQEGSYFIQTLCRVLQKWGHELEIENVMKKVKEIVSYEEFRTTNHLVSLKQMPEDSSSLRHSLRFARHEDWFIEAAIDLLVDRILETILYNLY